MKEVKNQDAKKKRLVKEDFELSLLNLLKKGHTPVEIAKSLGMKMGHLSYYLSSLKEKQIIKRVGIAWEVNPLMEVKLSSHKGKLQVGDLVKKDKRGHAFIWKVKPSKSFNWEQVLDKANVYSEPKGLVSTPRIIINGKKIWLGQNFITIWNEEDKSFFEPNSIQSKVKAVIDFEETVEALKKALDIEFKYTFRVKREHYGHIHNLLAKKFQKESKTYVIKNERGYWLSFDFSGKEYPELELIGTPGENDAVKQSLQVDDWWNSHERLGFKVNADFTLNKFKELSKIDEETFNRLKIESEKSMQIAQVIEQLQNNFIGITKEIIKIKQKLNKDGEL